MENNPQQRDLHNWITADGLALKCIWAMQFRYRTGY
jgi:hypothetical protein